MMDCLSPVAEALADAHKRGLLHLDIKPSDILLTADGQLMLSDFHLARGPIQPNEPVVDLAVSSRLFK